MGSERSHFSKLRLHLHPALKSLNCCFNTTILSPNVCAFRTLNQVKRRQVKCEDTGEACEFRGKLNAQFC